MAAILFNGVESFEQIGLEAFLVLKKKIFKCFYQIWA